MNQQMIFPPMVFYILAVWTIFWKGIALWHAARHHQKNWFIVMIVLILFNTLGTVEIVYLFFYAKPKFHIQSLVFWKKKEIK